MVSLPDWGKDILLGPQGTPVRDQLDKQSGSNSTALLDSEAVKNQQAFANNLQNAVGSYKATGAPQIGNDGSVSGATVSNPLSGTGPAVSSGAATPWSGGQISPFVDASGNPATNYAAPGEPPVDYNGFPLKPNPAYTAATSSGSGGTATFKPADPNNPPPGGYLVATDTNNPNYVPPSTYQGLPINTTNQPLPNGGVSAPSTQGGKPSIYGGPAALAQGVSVGGINYAAPGEVGWTPIVNAQQYSAPQTQGAAPISGVQQTGNIPQVNAQQIGQLGQITANAVSSRDISADQISGPGTIYSQQIGPQSAIKAGTVQADNIGNLGGVNAVDANVKGPGAENQDFALNLLKQGATGQGPSAAQAQFQLDADRAAKRTMAAAAANQTANAGAALREGIAGMAEGQQQAATQGAALRAQEQQKAQELFSQQATATGAQNLAEAQGNQGANMQAQIVTLQSNLDRLKANQAAALAAGQTNVASSLQAQIQNAQNQLDTAKANQAAALTASVQSASNQLETQKANQGANLSASQSNQATSLEAQKANQAAALQAQIVTQTNQLEALKANQAAALAAGQTNAATALQSQIANMQADLDMKKANLAAAEQTALANLGATVSTNQLNATTDLEAQKANQSTALSAGQTNATLATQTGIANMGAQLQSALKDADIASAMSQFNAAAQNDMTKFGATQALDQAKANLTAQLTNKGYDQQFIESLINSTNSALQGPVNAVMAQNTLNQQGAAANQAFLGSLIGTVGTVAAA